MRDMAIERGVPATAIVVDSLGLNTEATVDEHVRLFAAQGIDRVLVVSNAYHLPRIKLAYRRQGLEVFTVPAGRDAAHQGDAAPLAARGARVLGVLPARTRRRLAAASRRGRAVRPAPSVVRLVAAVIIRRRPRVSRQLVLPLALGHEHAAVRLELLLPDRLRGLAALAQQLLPLVVDPGLQVLEGVLVAGLEEVREASLPLEPRDERRP